MADFSNQMSKRSNSELLEITTILQNSYQPDAVIAAATELKNRNLSPQEHADALQILENKKQEHEKKTEKTKALQNKARNIADAFNPVTEKSNDKIIKMITFGLTISFLVYLFKNWELIFLMIPEIGNADLSMLEYFAPLILFPIGLYGFYNIKNYGWIILAILMTYLTITTLLAIGLEIKWSMQPPVQFDNEGPFQIEYPAMDNFFSRKGYAFYIGQLIIFGGLLIFLNKPAITEKFMISRRTQLLVVGLTPVPFILFWSSVLF